MDKIKLCLRYLDEHKPLFRTAVVLLIMTIAVLFYTLKEQDGNFSKSFTEPTAAEEKENGRLESSDAEIYVDIGGQVQKPGVYAVREGTRLFEVIERAGGLTEKAHTEQINRAETVTDGQKIWIPSAEESAADPGISAASGISSDGRININTADSALLQEIPGVGPSTADKIIAYRQENGRFQKPEDIRNVSGIGEKTYEKMKDRITV